MTLLKDWDTLMQMKEAWALEKPDAQTGAKRAGTYVGTHKTGSITAVGHSTYFKELTKGMPNRRVTVNKRKDGNSDVYVRPK